LGNVVVMKLRTETLDFVGPAQNKAAQLLDLKIEALRRFLTAATHNDTSDAEYDELLELQQRFLSARQRVEFLVEVFKSAEINRQQLWDTLPNQEPVELIACGDKNVVVLSARRCTAQVVCSDFIFYDRVDGKLVQAV
jgi:hypothetical protein